MLNSSTTESRKLKITKAFNDPKALLKILLGSETISEGVDLNGNTLVLYNCMLGWNPTEPVQVEGRLWRQGNLQKKVHIIYPLMYNSLDSLIYQKHDEKASRIDAIWEYRGDKINVEEINPAELKFDLIKSPEMKANIVLEQRSIPLKRELKIIEEIRLLINLAQERISIIQKEIDDFNAQIKQLDKDIEDTKKKNEGMPQEFTQLSDVIIADTLEERKKVEQAITSKNRAISLIQANLNKKIGSEFKDKKECLAALDKKQIDIESKLNDLYLERNSLVKQFAEQYEQEKSAQIQNVETIVQSVTQKILSNS